MAVAGLEEAFAYKGGGCRPYVQSGPDGVFYARCVPQGTNCSAGSTDIYLVKSDGDKLVDHYDWFTTGQIVLGWSPIAGKVGVMASRSGSPTSFDKQVELSFYLGGKFLKSWTTADLQRLGAEVDYWYGSAKRAVFQIIGCEQIPLTNEYVFTIQLAKDKKLSFDILTGDLYRK